MKQNIRILSLAMVLIIVISIMFIIPVTGTDNNLYVIDETPWDGSTVATSFAYGSGYEKNPYVIASAAQFAYFRDCVNKGDFPQGKYFVLACNINLGGFEWEPIGSIEALSFNGVFDGCGFTISNYKINVHTKAHKGLFGTIIYAGTVIQNLHIANAEISSTATGSYIGALVGYLKGEVTIKGVTIKSDVTVSGVSGSAGGIAGRIIQSGVAEYCINNARINSNSNGSNVFIGGICGAVGDKATLSYCINNGDIILKRDEGATATSFYAGGISGLIGTGNTGGTIKNSYNTGAITSSVAAGGITGRIHTTDNIIDNSYNLSENISGNVAYSGSIIGWLNSVSTFSGNIGVSINELGMYGTSFNPAQSDFSGFTEGIVASIQTHTNAIDLKIEEIISELGDIDYTPDPTATDEITTQVTEKETETTKSVGTTKPQTTTAKPITTQPNNTTKAAESESSGCNCNSSSVIITLVTIIGSAILFASKKIIRH